MIEAWRDCWRRGVGPRLPSGGLAALAAALRGDDPRLLQGAITEPPAVIFLSGEACTGACAVAFALWQNLPHPPQVPVARVERVFSELCFLWDSALGEVAACRWFLNWYDETPREEMRPLLLEEVELELARRVGTC